MFEVQVCGVGNLQKMLPKRWWHANTCAAQVIQYFNSPKENLANATH